MRRDYVTKSKLLSLALRHDPGALGLHLDAAGWASVDAVLAAMRDVHADMSREVLCDLVATNDKQRFEMSTDGSRIRAVQGHSLEVDLGLPVVAPPPVLFHGTAERHLASIRASGLVPGARDFVHLSADAVSARAVGARHGRPVLLEVDAQHMAAAGRAFHQARNGVWLTRSVPREFLRFPEGTP